MKGIIFFYVPVTVAAVVVIWLLFEKLWKLTGIGV